MMFQKVEYKVNDIPIYHYKEALISEECGDNKIDNNVANEEDNIIECVLI